MKINFNTTRLTSAVKSTGAQIKARQLTKSNRKYLVEFAENSLSRNGGLLVDDTDISPLQQIGGLIYYLDLWVIVTTKLSSLKKGGTFHVTECESCTELVKSGEYEMFPALKYYSTREKLVEAMARHELKACAKCLEIIDWDGFRDAEFWARQPVLERFSVNQFIETVESFEIERIFKLITDEFSTALPCEFPRILQSEKKKSRWKCASCKKEFSGFKNLFHILPAPAPEKDAIKRLEQGTRICLECIRIEHPHIELTDAENAFLDSLH